MKWDMSKAWKILTAILIFVVVISFLPGVVTGMSIAQALNYLASQGYYAYADPDYNWQVTGDASIGGDLDVTGDGSFGGSLQVSGANVTRVANFKVASSDDANSAQSDYLCDLSADEYEIQAALDACPANGGAVSLTPGGRYTISSQLVMSDNMSLFTPAGCPPAYIFLPAGRNCSMVTAETYSDVDYDDALYPDIGSGTANITLSNIIFDTNEPNNSGEHSPLRFVGVDGLTLENISVVNGGYDTFWNIQIRYSQNVYVNNLRSYSKMADVHGDGIHVQDCRNVNLNNIYGECGDDIVAATGRYKDSYDININNVTGFSRQGYMVTLGCDHNPINGGIRQVNVNNVSSENSTNAVRIVQSTNGSVKDININNLSCNVDLRGINIYDSEASDEPFYNINLNNIMIIGGTQPAIAGDNVHGIFMSNIVAKEINDHCISFSDSSNITLSSGILYSNQAGMSGFGFNASSGTITNVNVSGVTIWSDIATRGISISASSTTFNNVRIHDNYIDIPSNYYAINLASGTLNNVRVYDNDLTQCTNKVDYGSSTKTNVKVYRNIGYVTENSGTSTGTGAEQTVAHGLNITPGWDDIGVWSDNGTSAHVYMSSVPDATNIYVTCNASGSRWHWSTVNN